MGIYFSLFGLCVTLFALYATAGRVRLWLFGIRVRGVIVGTETRRSAANSGSKRRTYYFPVVQFETDDGTCAEFTFCSAEPETMPEIGDTVAVLYDPQSPGDATIDSFRGMWRGPILTILFGIGCLAGGLKMALE